MDNNRPPSASELALVPKIGDFARYAEMIVFAGRMSGCCGIEDASAAGEIWETGDAKFPAEVVVTTTFDGKNPLSHPVTLKFTADQYKVREAKEIADQCKVARAAAKAAHTATTCNMYPKPIIMGRDYKKVNSDGSFIIEGDPTTYRPGDTVNADAWESAKRYYCLLPAPAPDQ